MIHSINLHMNDQKQKKINVSRFCWTPAGPYQLRHRLNFNIRIPNSKYSLNPNYNPKPKLNSSPSPKKETTADFNFEFSDFGKRKFWPYNRPLSFNRLTNLFFVNAWMLILAQRTKNIFLLKSANITEWLRFRSLPLPLSGCRNRIMRLMLILADLYNLVPRFVKKKTSYGILGLIKIITTTDVKNERWSSVIIFT